MAKPAPVASVAPAVPVGSGGALVSTYPALRFSDLQALNPQPEKNHIMGNGFFRRGAWSLFTGGTGTGKSVLVEQTAACLSCGKPVFGFRVARPFRVLLLTAELCRRFRQAVHRSAKSNGVTRPTGRRA